jgi:hypothetical protein
MLTRFDLLLQRWFPPTLGNLRVDSSSVRYYERMRLSDAFAF